MVQRVAKPVSHPPDETSPKISRWDDNNSGTKNNSAGPRRGSRGRAGEIFMITEFWNVDGIPSFGIAYHLDTWRLVTTATIEAACLL